MRIEFTQATRKHRIGRAHIRAAMANAGEPTTVPAEQEQVADRFISVGTDDRGVELELIAVATSGGALPVNHVMPTRYRRRS